jgi:hypothetical protein
LDFARYAGRIEWRLAFESTSEQEASFAIVREGSQQNSSCDRVIVDVLIETHPRCSTGMCVDGITQIGTTTPGLIEDRDVSRRTVPKRTPSHPWLDPAGSLRDA